MSGNGRNQIFVWKSKQEACAIRRVYERMYTTIKLKKYMEENVNILMNYG